MPMMIVKANQMATSKQELLQEPPNRTKKYGSRWQLYLAVLMPEPLRQPPLH